MGLARRGYYPAGLMVIQAPAERALFFYGGMDTEDVSCADAARRIAEGQSCP